MIFSLLVQAALAAAASAAPPDREQMACAFGKARELATSSVEAPDVLADKIVAECTAKPPGAPEAGDAEKAGVRAAALAMINRKRGTDGQPPDAPLAIPSFDTVEPFDIPDEIAPAIGSYVVCVNASRGVPMYDRSMRLVEPPPGIGKGSDCTTVRKTAVRWADRLLRGRGGMGKRERRAFIFRAFADVDAFLGVAAPSTP